MVVTKQQYQILNSCADDWELFYFPFAMVNFGGQVFRRSDGLSCARYDDQGPWSITVAATEIARDVAVLVNQGLLACHEVRVDGGRQVLANARAEEFEVYRGYECLTFDDHVERFGYGPHEFKVTDRGMAEIQDDRYRAYDQDLGWQ